ncbi:MAG: DUF4271 domain-containing protein [Saprospiraceae bacterium]|nr:DUF4271 domain-containing protein [Saprospiraceae bacterium]
MQKKYTQLQIYFFSLLFWSFCTLTFAQQQSDNNGLLAEKPTVVENKPLQTKPRITKSSFTKILPSSPLNNNILGTLTIKSWQDPNPKIVLSPRKSGDIDRKYYAENPFMIAASDNPFALKIEGLQRNTKQSNKRYSGLESSLDEIFYKDKNTKTKHQHLPSWLILVFLGLLALITVAISVYRHDLKKTFHAFVNTNSAGQLFREQKDFRHPITFVSLLIFSMVIGLFIFLLVGQLSGIRNFYSATNLLICIGGVVGLSTLKNLQLKILGNIFPFQQEVNLYSFILSNTNRIIGYTFLPLVFLIAYAPDSIQPFFLYLSFGILGLTYIYRGFRGLVLASDIILFHKFHFFLYLCTVELAPLLILLKVLSLI